MLTSRIQATDDTVSLISQMNNIINEIIVELNQAGAKILERDKRISQLEDRAKILQIENKDVKKFAGDIFRSISAKTLKMGSIADADVQPSTLYVSSAGVLKFKDSNGVIHSIMNLISAYESTIISFFQNDTSGSQFGLSTHKFMINPLTQKLALYEHVTGDWVHKVDFGSILTSQFTFTEPMGGVVYRGPDGYDYSAVRASPTGNGRGIAVGNYAGPLFLTSDLSGVFMTYEKGPDYYKVDPVVNNVPSKVASKVFYHKVKVTSPTMIYGGCGFIDPSPVERKLICRHWTEDFNGKILHQTVSNEDWNKTNVPAELERVCHAEYVTIPANSNKIPLYASIPMPITDYGKSFDVKMCWEFKETLSLYGSAIDALKFELEREDGAVERVASREYVDAKIAAIPSVDISGKANIDSPSFTGNPTAPTQQYYDSDTSIATTAFVHSVTNSSVTISTSGTTLSTGVARVEVIRWTGGNGSMTTPATNKHYTVVNAGTGAVTLSHTSGGQGVTVPVGCVYKVYVESSSVKTVSAPTAYVGDTKRSFRPSDHDGWVVLDGRAVSLLTGTQRTAALSLGWGSNLPDTRGRLAMSASVSYPSGSYGGSNLIAQNALPNVSVPATGSVTEAMGHTHTFIAETATDGSHSHGISGNYGWNGTNTFGFSDRPQTANTHTLVIPSSGEHKHFVSGETFGDGAHTHSLSGVTTGSINGGVTQQKHVPEHYALNEFVFLGV